MIKDLKTVFGKEGTTKLQNAKVLMVGSGGIGCELLKNLVLLGYREIHVVDMDTIDLSNLNRQFLFRFRDIKKFKSEVACAAVSEFAFANFSTKLVAYTENIMNFKLFDIAWFEQFDVIMNALDNLEARRYINKLCQYVRKPLFETGTSGFDGFAMPMLSKTTECFDCTSKETPKTYPVCTIRSTPSQPVHCVVWAKGFLFQELLGDIQEDTPDQDYGTDDQEEIQRIKSQQNELHELVLMISDPSYKNLDEVVEKTVNKVFVDDIKKLLAIDSLWKTRTPPRALDLSSVDFKIVEVEGLDKNKEWSLSENINQFIVSLKKLITRKRLNNNAGLEFDKDDNDALLFLASAANIRSEIFSISTKTVFDIKQIAGNIIPAIATTNAIIASFSTLNSLKLVAFGDDIQSLKSSFTSWATGTSNRKYMNMVRLNKPNPECSVCSKTNNMIMDLNTNATLGQTIEFLRTTFADTFPEDISVMNLANSSVIYDFDFEDLVSTPLFDIIRPSPESASFVLILDEDTENTLCKPIQILLNWTDTPQISVNAQMLEKYTKSIKEEHTDTHSDAVVNDDGEIVLVSDDEGEPAHKKHKLDDDHFEVLSD
mgnify:CR=1 FL=1